MIYRILFIALILGSLTHSVSAQCPTSGTISSSCTTTGNLTIDGGTLTVNSGVIVTVTGTLRVQNNGHLIGTGATFSVGNLADGYNTLNTITGGNYTVSGTFSAGSGGGFSIANAVVNATGATSLSGDTIAIQNTTISTSSFDVNLDTLVIEGSTITSSTHLDLEEANVSNSTLNIGEELILNSGYSGVSNTTINAGTSYGVSTGVVGMTMNGGGTLVLSNGSDMDITGDVTNNFIIIDNSDVVISGNFDNVGDETVIVRNNGTLRVNGNFANNGSGNLTGTSGGAITVDGDFNNTGGGSADVTGGSLTVGGTFLGATPAGGGNCDSGGGGCCGVCTGLPVLITEYNVRYADGKAMVWWHAAAELSCDRYQVWKSTDLKTFELIGEVAGRGTTVVGHDYELHDVHPSVGTSYYKLIQIDFDGTQHNEGTRVLSVSKDQLQFFQIYPTVTQGESHLNLLFAYSINGSVALALYDQNGRRVADLEVKVDGRHGEIQWPSSSLHSGIYFLMGTVGEQIIRQKILHQD